MTQFEKCDLLQYKLTHQIIISFILNQLYQISMLYYVRNERLFKKLYTHLILRIDKMVKYPYNLAMQALA